MPRIRTILRAARTGRALAPLATTANAVRPVSFGQPLGTWAFAVGWHVSELPLATLGVQAALTARALRKGKWKTPAGLLRIGAQAASAAGLWQLQKAAADAKGVLEEALVAGLGADYTDLADKAGIGPAEGPEIHPWAAMPAWLTRRSRLRASAIQYGPHGKRNRLDIWASPDIQPGDKAPVLIQVPGGGWVMGDTRHQAYPLMDRLRTAGWVCVPISYRLSPKSTWPDHIVDVKRAIAWVKANIADYGGDPDFIVITGGSAGGHLSSLAALTPNEPEFQPGFEDADTRVQAAVPFYGVYDLLDWNGNGGPAGSVRHIEKMVLKSSPTADRERWLHASPLHWASTDAPPMMILHGDNDSLVPVDGARRLSRALQAASNQAVVYAELPKAQHAFDIYASLRTAYTVRAVEHFLAYVRAGYVLAGGPSAPSASEGVTN
ncbi:MAG TPA: alpha/beta hydrolase [Acidimicrobiales bacterium]|nr:alpha/beta hydrolase [Acidimicrobiales bacterium]